MKMQKAEEKTRSYRAARRRFAWALAVSFLPQGAFCLAEDGVRELRSPAEMEKVAPVRAIGIRLMPAVPFDPLTTKPQVNETEPKLPAPAEPPEPKQPERIVPKPKVALTSTDRQLIQSFQIQAQAPIRLTFSNSTASLASVSTTAAEVPAPLQQAADQSPVTETTKGTETTKRNPWNIGLPKADTVDVPSPKLLNANQAPAVYPAVDMNVDVRDETPVVASVLDIPNESSQGLVTEAEGDRGIKMPVKIAISVPPRVTSHATALPEALPILVAPAPPVFTDGASRPIDVHDPEPMPSFEAPSRLPASLEPTALEPTALEPDASMDEALLLSETKGDEAIPLRLEGPKATPKPSYSEEQLEKALAVELDSQSAREILFDTPIDRIVVSDEKVCRAMASDGRVYLVGLELGESMIEVQPKDGMESRLLRVKVVAPWQRSHGAMDLNQLVHAIAPLSPNGNLTIQAKNDGSLVVRGTVDSKETAKRIMELIRKMILVPVVDQLNIR